MKSETKVCQNCKNDFTIEPDDFLFYEKIKVPPPTFCPECRLQRKMAWRNERSFYNNTCSLCDKNIISIYNKNSPFLVYCNDCWWGDNWDVMSYGKEYNFLEFFLKQFNELILAVPRVSLFQKGNIDSPYTNHADHNKNCYLCFNNGFIEDSMYSKWGVKSNYMYDSYSILDSSFIYESMDLTHCNNCIYAINSKDCFNSSFIYNCSGCNNCFLSTNLRNKKYVFKNKQYSKQEYNDLINKIKLTKFSIINNIINDFKGDILKNIIRKYASITRSINSTGDIIFGSKNSKKCFHLIDTENCSYCVDNSSIKDSYDTYESAFNCELQYDSHACNRLSNGKWCNISYDCHHLTYCDNCHSCSNCFACIGLRSKQYCILNRQYTKEQYEELVPKIIQHMNDMPYIDSKGRVYKYGEFFPSELSPFCYNETIAQEYFPLTKEEAIKQGYKWKDKEERSYQIDIKNEDIPDDINDIDESIVNKVIECSHKGTCNQQCTEAFKIIPEEYQFYKRMNLPIPRLCPNCRHYERLSQRNPLKLWHRTCMHEGCTNEFETSYAPERSEIVYCEKCYQQEVY